MPEEPKPIQTFIDNWSEGLNVLDKAMYDKVMAITKDLELDAQGNVKINVSNIRTMNKVRQELEKEVRNFKSKGETYADKVAQIKPYINQIQKEQQEYFATVFKEATKGQGGFKLKKDLYLEELRKQQWAKLTKGSKQALESYTGLGYYQINTELRNMKEWNTYGDMVKYYNGDIRSIKEGGFKAKDLGL